MMARSGPSSSIPTLAQKRKAVVMNGEPDRLVDWLGKHPPESHIEYIDLLKATVSGRTSNGPIAKPEVQKSMQDVIFTHIREKRSTPGFDDSDLSTRSIFRQALVQSTKEVAVQWIPLEFFEREHEYLLQTRQFLILVVRAGFSEILYPIFNKVTSSTWSIEQRMFFVFAKDHNDVTALVHAIRRGDTESVRAIISFCAEKDREVYHIDSATKKKVHLLEKQDGVGRETPLHEAIHLMHQENFEATAIAKKNALEIVREIINARPQTLCQVNGNGDPPYSYARKGGADEKIEDFLKAEIFAKLSSVVHVRKALYGKQDQEKEIYLDLSDFNYSSHDFDFFIRDLTKYAKPDSLARDLQFEKTLLYVTLPDLELLLESNVHETIRDFFNWLRAMEVHTIKELNIPDRRAQPLPEDFVHTIILKHFCVERLNWRKLDMDISILKGPRTVSSLKGLKLYSSGSWSILYHWASEDGVNELPKLDDLAIDIIKPIVWTDGEAEQRHLEKAVGYKRMLEFTFSLGGLAKPKIVADAEWPKLEPHSLFEDEITVPSLKIFECFTNCQRYLNRLQRMNDHRNPFAQRFRDHSVKIAIVDNGVDKIRTTLSANIEKGRSFVYHGIGAQKRWLPWWVVADPHGTQMASLIQRVNPYCRLYIARVGEGRKDIRPSSAAKAVEWAVAQKVHIISLSWTLRSDEKRLRNAIAAAVSQKILVFASTADEGVAAATVWPACYPGVIRVSASDRYAHPRLASDTNVDVMVNGEAISADHPAYMKNYKHDVVSGSSVATAIAAAIASLALLLKGISTDGKDDLSLRDKDEIMKTVFSKMGKGGKGIQPFKLFGEGFGTDDTNMRNPAWISMFEGLSKEDVSYELSSDDE